MTDSSACEGCFTSGSSEQLPDSSMRLRRNNAPLLLQTLLNNPSLFFAFKASALQCKAASLLLPSRPLPSEESGVVVASSAAFVLTLLT